MQHSSVNSATGQIEPFHHGPIDADGWKVTMDCPWSLVEALRDVIVPIPAQAGHPFHANLDSRSEATRGVDAVYAGVGSSVNLGWIFRRDSPARLRAWAWWTRRSRMASARVGSPRASCQWATGNGLVTRVERV